MHVKLDTSALHFTVNKPKLVQMFTLSMHAGRVSVVSLSKQH